jgi:hypothetical protein
MAFHRNASVRHDVARAPRRARRRCAAACQRPTLSAFKPTSQIPRPLLPQAARTPRRLEFHTRRSDRAAFYPSVRWRPPATGAPAEARPPYARINWPDGVLAAKPCPFALVAYKARPTLFSRSRPSRSAVPP